MTTDVTNKIRNVTIAFALLALAACQTVKSSHCKGFDAIPPSIAEIDVMTPERKARVLAELLKFERICGVKKP